MTDHQRSVHQKDLVAEERLRLEIDRQFPDHWTDDPKTASASAETRVNVDLPLSVVLALKERAKGDRAKAGQPISPWVFSV